MSAKRELIEAARAAVANALAPHSRFAAGAMDADGAGTGDSTVPSCGRRQMMNEAEQVAGRTLAIYCAAPDGDAVVKHGVAELLPFAFGPADLGHSPRKN